MKQYLLQTFIISLGLFSNFSEVKAADESNSPMYVAYDGFTKSPDLRLFVNDQEVFVALEDCFGDRTFNTAQYASSGVTEVKIKSAKPIEEYEIRPRHLKIKSTHEGDTITFSIDGPQMLFVTIDEAKPLCLFHTPNEEQKPDANDPNVLYFAKGIHEVGVLTPKTGQTVYLEQGALLKGRIYADGVDNVSVIGRGILDARGFTSKPDAICGIEFKNSNHILIDGIGLRTGIWWQTLFLLCKDVEVRNMNLMSFGINNDGLDIDGVERFLAKNCFIGCGDDGFGWHALDAEANGQPPSIDCVAENCVIYNTHAGNGLRVGASMETELFKNITFRDITVLAHANAGIRSDHSDWAMVKNLRFENFYIESPTRPIEIRIEFTRYTNKTGYRDERGHIEGLIFKNVHAAKGEIVLEGYDADHAIRDVLFEDVFVAGEKIDSVDQIKANEFVYDIKFR